MISLIRVLRNLKQRIMKELLNLLKTILRLHQVMLYIGVIDSGIYFNAGLAAYNGKMYDKAIPYFQKCADMKYEGTHALFSYISIIYGKRRYCQLQKYVLKKALNYILIIRMLFFSCDYYYKTIKAT